MPIYEFSCECGNEKEDLVSVGTEHIKCEGCGKDMKKIISRSSFILKGSGWAFDNYGSKIIKKPTNNKQRE
jgi:putative FmdB family regulatory protein